MDREQFDALTRLIAAQRSRRSVIAALLGAALLGPAPSVAAKRKGKHRGRQRGGNQESSRKATHHGKSKRRNGNGRKAQPASTEATRCCSTGNCVPGKGKNLSRCCYAGQNLTGKNFSGANLGGANLSRATLSGANFQGANLGKACLVDADLRGIRANSSTNWSGAIFCRTRTDSGEDNSGRGQGTPCCPTCDDANPCEANDVCCNGRCVASGALCDISACPPPSTPCREAFCTCEGACGERNLGDGTPCVNEDLCTVDDVCLGGVCTGGLRKFCEQPNHQCRVARCNPATGECEERNKEPFTPCDDGNPCTERDHCDFDGECVGFQVQCFGERICCPSGPFRGQCRGGPGDQCFGNSGCCNENCIPFANVCNPF